MNLIELFESKQFQDVGTFNSIFKATPILGFSSSSEVEICGVTAKGRRVLVNEQELFIDLLANERAEKLAKVRRLTQRVRKPKAKKVFGTLPPLFHKLNAGEFMVHAALKELGEVSDAHQFSTVLPMERRTIHNLVTSLEAKGMVKIEREGKFIVRISLTQEMSEFFKK
jgi:DNA-binding transcriptional ArsR family regulator